MKFFKPHIIIVLMLFAISAKSQETLRGLQVNPEIQHVKENVAPGSNKSSQSKAAVELPFFDDFSTGTGFPNNSSWTDKYTFVNHSYAYLPITVGVVTFDAINGTGSIYPEAGEYSFPADTLTSIDINLNYPGSSTIFLSFYYQPGGLGDSPELKDSLLLEFYAADSSRWYKKWHVVYDATDSLLNEKYFSVNDTTTKIVKADTLVSLTKKFHRVFIPVNEEVFLTDTFQFRFRNYASLSSGENAESKASNVDQWNVDYIYLDKGRSSTDTIFNDYAFVEPMGSLLRNYESVPWPHYQRASAYEISDHVTTIFRNLYGSPTALSKRMSVIDLMGPTGTYLDSLGALDAINYMAIDTQRTPIEYNFPISLNEDSALFEIQGYFFDNTDENVLFRANDTTSYFQKFYNYYAYDDGTAESGYGIIGEGTERAMVAMRFNTYKQDTLRAIQMYFNQVLNDANQYSFKLNVWSDIEGKPGNIIYTKENLRPENADELNKYITYKLDTVLVLSGNFFIGWQKGNSPEMLNVGFDVNRIHNDKLFYNISGEWVKSQLKGTIMIRPLFGKNFSLPTDILIPEKPKEEFNYTIYPNPANNILNIEISNTGKNKYRFTVFDIYGRVFIDKYSPQESYLNIANLKAGVYFIKISKSNGASGTKKFIIAR